MQILVRCGDNPMDFLSGNWECRSGSEMETSVRMLTKFLYIQMTTLRMALLGNGERWSRQGRGCWARVPTSSTLQWHADGLVLPELSGAWHSEIATLVGNSAPVTLTTSGNRRLLSNASLPRSVWHADTSFFTLSPSRTLSLLAQLFLPLLRKRTQQHNPRWHDKTQHDTTRDYMARPNMRKMPQDLNQPN